MNGFDKAPINVNASILALGMKVNALVEVLSEEQKGAYDEKMKEWKDRAKELSELLSPEEFEAFKAALDS